MKSLIAFGFDGTEALESVLRESRYGSVEQAVASLAVFGHPETVAQARGEPLFRIKRGPIPQRGQIVSHDDGRRVLLDDNTGATDAFIWSNLLRRGAYNDIQFCHIWQASNDPDAYTNLANLCVLPAFLAKLSDTDHRITVLLQQRAEELYGWRPRGAKGARAGLAPQTLTWSETFPPNHELEARLRQHMTTKPKSRTTISARAIGWLFSDWRPDESLPSAP